MDIRLSEAGILPTDSNLCQKFIELFDSLKADTSYNIIFDKADYYFDTKNNKREKLYISNTIAKTEPADGIRSIAMYLKGLKNVTLDGCGARLIFIGKTTGFYVESCFNVTLKNLTIDYFRPTVSEFACLSASKNAAIIRINHDSHYRIENGKLVFFGPDCDYVHPTEGLTQEYNPENNSTSRIECKFFWKYDVLKNHDHAETLPDGTVRLTFSKSGHQLKEGFSYEYRVVTRDNVGFFISHSENTVIDNLTINFMHGLGIVAQLSNSLKILNTKIVPKDGRHTAAFADMIHCIACSGVIDIENCVFDGAHDDALNVHGVHQPIISCYDNTIRVRFAHPQAYGYNCFKFGDIIEIVDKRTLLPAYSAKVLESVMDNEYETTLSLDKPITLAKLKYFVVDNVTTNPDVIFKNNKIYNIPTRGLLLTTRGKAEVAFNYFYRTNMSAILISDDANSWFESGPIRDVSIHDNEFDKCAEPVILIKPENKKHRGSVHKNISIYNNVFNLRQAAAVFVKSSENVLIENNTLSQSTPIAYVHKHCKNVTIK